ncbi:MAG: hypothetical protein IT379_40115 [Deltaproteobacteria bacterium]|nr:hypothetical protein [Deltaproteobacteria bacterium]
MSVVKQARSRRPPPGAAVPAAFVAACAVWLGIAAVPREVPPPLPPPIVILAGEAAEQRRADDVVRARLPRDSTVAAADDAFRRYGTTSLAPGGEQLTVQAQEDFRRFLGQIELSHGRNALRALRAEHVWSFVEVLGQPTARGRALRAELGGDLVDTLTRGGLLRPGPSRAVPEPDVPLAAIAVFAKARWNVVAGDERTRELDAFELFVFHGYRATRLKGVRPATRLQALQDLTPFAHRYPVRLALGGARYHGGDYDGAMADLMQAMDDGMSFRIRNYLRATAARASQ